ncbi:MAG: hypothetical protein LBQ80_05770 [Clostridium sp.]|jgi:hypothetical protein|nr:hypothetical protein [Clostridium sp.]
MKEKLYKIITAGLSLGGVAALLLLPIARFAANVSAVLIGDISADFKINALWIFRLIKDKQTGVDSLDSLLSGETLSGASIWENLGEIRVRLIIFATAVALCLLLAVAVAVLVLVLKKSKGVILPLSAAGFFSAVTASAAFSSVSAPFLSGKTSLSDVLGSLASLASIEIQRFSLGSAVTLVLVLFVLIFVACAAFMLADFIAANSKPKKKKKKPAAAKKK